GLGLWWGGSHPNAVPQAAVRESCRQLRALFPTSVSIPCPISLWSPPSAARLEPSTHECHANAIHAALQRRSFVASLSCAFREASSAGARATLRDGPGGPFCAVSVFSQLYRVQARRAYPPVSSSPGWACSAGDA